MRQAHRKTTILFQMIVGYSFILVVVISAISYFSYRYSSQVVYEKTTQYMLESVIQMSGKIDGMLGEYDRLSMRVAFHPATQQYLITANGRTSADKQSAFDVQKVVTHEQGYIRNDFLVDIMDIRGTLAFHQPSTAFELSRAEWFDLMESEQGRIVWTNNTLFNRTENATDEALMNGVLGVRQVRDYASSSNKIGYMFIGIPISVTERVIGNFLTSPSIRIQVLDRMGNIVYSTNPDDYWKKVEPAFLREVSGGRSGGTIKRASVNGTAVYMSSYTSDYSGWTVVTYIREADAVKDLRAMQNSILLIGTLGIAASLLLTSFFSWTLSLPIRHLALRLSKIRSGKLMQLRGKLNNREVSILYESFNEMIMHLEETIKLLSLKQIRENQAQLVALKAQFRPHFLYNSLNVIYYYAVKERQSNVASMVLALSDLLRYSIQPGSEFVALREDLAQLERFVRLQRYRYEDKLQVELTVDESLLAYRVMRLLLQPIVENAITHGLEPKKGDRWLIRIRIAAEDGTLRFEIDDNGVGMTAEAMAKALDFSEALEMDGDRPMQTGLGLPNLQHRIQLVYGAEYGLTLSASELGGLKVRLALPIST